MTTVIKFTNAEVEAILAAAADKKVTDTSKSKWSVDVTQYSGAICTLEHLEPELKPELEPMIPVTPPIKE